MTMHSQCHEPGNCPACPEETRPTIAFIKIPARHVDISNPQSMRRAIVDVQRAILKGSPLPGWAIADFDAGNVEIVEGRDIEIKPIPELPS